MCWDLKGRQSNNKKKVGGYTANEKRMLWKWSKRSMVYAEVLCRTGVRKGGGEAGPEECDCQPFAAVPRISTVVSVEHSRIQIPASHLASGLLQENTLNQSRLVAFPCKKVLNEGSMSKAKLTRRARSLFFNSFVRSKIPSYQLDNLQAESKMKCLRIQATYIGF